MVNEEVEVTTPDDSTDAEEPDTENPSDNSGEVESEEIDIKDSILLLTKKKLGIAPDYKAFDEDIITDINTVIMTLRQLGIGPEEGFAIEDEKSKWSDFIGDTKLLEAVKTFIYMSVRLMFDPPTSSFVVAAMERQVKELEWRLNEEAELQKLKDNSGGAENGE